MEEGLTLLRVKDLLGLTENEVKNAVKRGDLIAKLQNPNAPPSSYNKYIVSIEDYESFKQQIKYEIEEDTVIGLPTVDNNFRNMIKSEYERTKIIIELLEKMKDIEKIYELILNNKIESADILQLAIDTIDAKKELIPLYKKLFIIENIDVEECSDV
jgi:hypothetical protein